VCIAAAESLSAQALSFDIIARKIIMADPSWKNGHYYTEPDIPEKGLSLARMIGHITYLSRESMEKKFGRERREDMEKSIFNTDFQVESYLNYQGRQFVERFDANSFLYITSAMSSFSLSERAASLEDVFKETKARFLIVSVSSDWLYPAEQSQELAEHILRAGKKVSYCNLKAPYGHDSFLIENRELSDVISSFFCGSRYGGPSPAARSEGGETKREQDIIMAFMDPPGSVLDLGCGDGAFLVRTTAEKKVAGLGVDIDFANVIQCNRREVPVFQVDLDRGLDMIPDRFYDYAVLSRTLVEVHKPYHVLREMLRVAKVGIVNFFNFGAWRNRLKLLWGGRLHVPGGDAPDRWYDMPLKHFLTLEDFRAFCRENDIEILAMHSLPQGVPGRILSALGLHNAGAERVIVKITKKAEAGKEKEAHDGRE